MSAFHPLQTLPRPGPAATPIRARPAEAETKAPLISPRLIAFNDRTLPRNAR